MTDNKYSFEYAKDFILHNQASHVIEQCEKSLSEEENKSNKIALLFNVAIAKLSLQMTRASIKNLQSILVIDQTTTIASFFLGLAHLWLGHENDAITVWNEGLSHGGPISYFSVMKRLTFDCNARSFIYSRRFDVLSVLDFVEDFDKEIVYMDNDVQRAYSELRNSSLSSAISHFNIILANDPDNIDALKGRGSAECMTGQWRRAIDDLTKVIEKGYTDDGQLAKIRGVAFAALGQYTAAITDFSVAISLSSSDSEGRLERARLHMIRKCYTLALEDYTSIPITKLNDQMLIDLAECYYAVGDVPHAAEIIMKVKSTTDDHRKSYCHYLITRDVGRIGEASLQIVHAATLLPSFFLLRTAADFMYEQGKFIDADGYYRNALKQKENDAETQRMFALSLFQSGAEIQAVEILKKLRYAYAKMNDEIDFGEGTFCQLEIDGHMRNFRKNPPNISVLRSATDDLHYIIHIMNNSEKTIIEAARPSFSKTIEITLNEEIHTTTIENSEEDDQSNKSEEKDKKHSPFKVSYESIYDDEPIPLLFHFSKFLPSKEELGMLEDADRLGKRCMPHAPEVVDNKRIIRCLGFCVLCLAQHMRQEYFVHPKSSWRNAFDLLRCIMSLADITKSVRWTSSIQNPAPRPAQPKIFKEPEQPKKYVVFPSLAPTFFIQNGERRSPRFGHAMHQCIKVLSSAILKPVSTDPKFNSSMFETNSLVKLNTLDAIYSVAQTDIIYNDYWESQIMNSELNAPSISLRYIGEHGYELFLRPPLGEDDAKKYDQTCQEVWSLLMQQHSMENSFYLPLMMMLIWLWQPISDFCNEFGHVIMHAYLLASKNAEVEKIPCQSGELFMKQMTNPKYETMKKVISDHLLEAKVAPMVRDESLLFWKELPTIAHLYPLIDYDISE